jgi:hypothetical protein
VLPTLQGAEDVGNSKVYLPGIGSQPGLPSLQTVIPDSLKRIQTQIPNLNVQGFTLKMPELAGQNFFVPPIPGVVVIPGDIGFLNQYFSVMLMIHRVVTTCQPHLLTLLRQSKFPQTLILCTNLNQRQLCVGEKIRVGHLRRRSNPVM